MGGRGRGKVKTTGLKVFYNNINGYTSKKDSLARIIEDVDPDVIALCETKKYGHLKKGELSKYDIIECDLKQGQEGLMIGVRKGSFKSIREVTDTELKSILSVRIVFPEVNVRVVVAHAPQVNAKTEERLEFFEEMSVQIERAISSEDACIVVGDFNAKISVEMCV